MSLIIVALAGLILIGIGVCLANLASAVADLRASQPGVVRIVAKSVVVRTLLYLVAQLTLASSLLVLAPEDQTAHWWRTYVLARGIFWSVVIAGLSIHDRVTRIRVARALDEL